MARINILEYSEFMNDLHKDFTKTPLISSAKALVDMIESIPSKPDALTSSSIKNKLQNLGIISYSAKAPRGYSFNIEIKKEETEKAVKAKSTQIEKKEMKKAESKKKIRVNVLEIPEFMEELNQIFENTPLIAAAKTLLEFLEDMTHRPEEISAKSIKTKLQKEQIILYSGSAPRGYSLAGASPISDKSLTQKSVQNKAKETKSTVKKPTAAKKTTTEKKEKISEEEKPKNFEEILDNIPSFSRYLMKRLTPKAIEAINLGKLRIPQLPIKKIEEYYEHLEHSRMFFSDEYENEKEILDYVRVKAKYMNTIMEERHDNEADHILNEILGKKKIKKIIESYSMHSLKNDMDEIGYQIFEKIGPKRKKIALNDYALRKRICELITKKYVM